MAPVPPVRSAAAVRARGCSRIATSSVTDQGRSRSYVEAKVHDVAVAHHVVLALDVELAVVAAARFTPEFDEIFPPDDLRLDEPLLEVGVNHACGLRCARPSRRGP